MKFKIIVTNEVGDTIWSDAIYMDDLGELYILSNEAIGKWMDYVEEQVEKGICPECGGELQIENGETYCESCGWTDDNSTEPQNNND